MSDPADAGGDNLRARIAGVLAAARVHLRPLSVASAIGAAIGVLAAFTLPRYYTSTASFQPESASPSLLGNSGLAGLASQLGATALGGGPNAQFYADLVTSQIVTRRLAQASFPAGDGIQPIAQIYGYGSLEGEKRLQRTAAKLAKSLTVSLNFRTGVVAFSVEGRSPEMAKLLADSVLAVLNDFNISIRQSRARAERKFTSARVADARDSLSHAEDALAAFNMRNRVANSPGLQVERDRFQRAVDVASQIYLQLRGQAEQAALQEVRDTPALTVIDPPLLPIRQSWPNRRLTVIAATLAGFLVAALYLLATSSAAGPAPGAAARF
jgi:uncharacterized protein involved in exopolysaccharide biosynthesis